jgi:hypothetical protein
MFDRRSGSLLLVVLALALSASAQSANAELITSTTGPPPGGSFSAGAPMNSRAIATSWILPEPFEHVSITADVGAAGEGVTGTAFLTTKVGAGTTAADQVAQAPFTFPRFVLDPVQTVTLFSDLTLESGVHYFLILSTAATVGATWHVTSILDETRLSFPGVQTAGSTFAAPFSELITLAPLNPYAPASTFTPFTSTSLFSLDLIYSVAGDLVGPGGEPGPGTPGPSTGVPAPATLALLVMGLPTVGWMRRRRSWHPFPDVDASAGGGRRHPVALEDE